MTIALLVAVTQWLNAHGLLTATAVTPNQVVIAFLATAAATAGFVALRYSDFVIAQARQGCAPGAGRVVPHRRKFVDHASLTRSPGVAAPVKIESGL
jgi:hypothetical protein